MANTFDYYTYLERSITEDIRSEIGFYESTGMSEVYPIGEYVRYLRNRIYNVGVVYINNYGKYGKHSEMKKMNVEEYTKDLNKLIYNRNWTKLKDFHKKKKIHEYVDALEYPKDVDPTVVTSNKAFLTEAIFRGTKNKRFKKGCNEIIYNKDKMEIENIDCVVFDEETRKYRLEWV